MTNVILKENVKFFVWKFNGNTILIRSKVYGFFLNLVMWPNSQYKVCLILLVARPAYGTCCAKQSSMFYCEGKSIETSRTFLNVLLVSMTPIETISMSTYSSFMFSRCVQNFCTHLRMAGGYKIFAWHTVFGTV